MCGFAGFYAPGQAFDPDWAWRTARVMGDEIAHRGPDDADEWVDGEAGVALAFRRLAIIDLTDAGRQPMVSADGRHVIVYNGEIYNAEAIRPDLERLGVTFRGHSDTEVMLEGFAQWGVDETLSRLVGMFALALWDRRERKLTLVRDRMGIKPLVWGRIGKTIFFGSQAKSFRHHPDWRGEIDPASVAAFMRYAYIPAPLSIYKGLQQLAPGELVEIAADGRTEARIYWDAGAIALSGAADRRKLSDKEATDALDSLLSEAVRSRMASDVPLGAFLSGGVDSSTIVSLMQEQSSQPVKTFTIGFNAPGYNEAQFAKRIAEHLKTDHHELYVEPSDAEELIPSLADWYDEPFADSSQMPTYLVSRMARQQVTVSLSGDGGDELFAGYTRHVLFRKIRRGAGLAPPPVRRAASAAIHSIRPAAFDRVANLLPLRRRPMQVGYRMHKLADMVLDPSVAAAYRSLVSQWTNPDAIVVGGGEPPSRFLTDPVIGRLPSELESIIYADQITYLPGDILTKVDRASMAVGLEARVPIVDHRVVEFAWTLPTRFKLRDGVGKWLLRQVLYRRVPRGLIDRPKMGFGVPIEHWLRGSLRDWAEDLLSARSLSETGILDPEPIRQIWRDHLSGRRNWHSRLWCVLMFQAWNRRWMVAEPPAADLTSRTG